MRITAVSSCLAINFLLTGSARIVSMVRAKFNTRVRIEVFSAGWHMQRVRLVLVGASGHRSVLLIG